MPRIKGSRLTQEAKDSIAAGMRKFRAKQREEREELKEKPKEEIEEKKIEKQIPPARPDTLGFHLKDTKEHLIVFPVKDIVPEIVFDFERSCIKINLDGAFSITSGNWDREEMKDLAMVLNRNYRPEKRQRLDVVKRLRGVRKDNRGTAIDKFFDNIIVKD